MTVSVGDWLVDESAFKKCSQMESCLWSPTPMCHCVSLWQPHYPSVRLCLYVCVYGCICLLAYASLSVLLYVIACSCPPACQSVVLFFRQWVCVCVPVSVHAFVSACALLPVCVSTYVCLRLCVPVTLCISAFSSLPAVPFVPVTVLALSLSLNLPCLWLPLFRSCLSLWLSVSCSLSSFLFLPLPVSLYSSLPPGARFVPVQACRPNGAPTSAT